MRTPRWALVLSLTLGVLLPDSVGAESWRLVVAPLDAVKEHDSVSELLERTSLSEWTPAKVFDTAEACESEVRARSLASAQARRDLSRQRDDARRRGDTRMVEIVEALASYRARDAAALCVTTNAASPGR